MAEKSVVNPIPIKLDEPYGSKLSLWGMRRYHEITGKSIMRGEVQFNDLSEDQLIDLLWACLLWDDSKPEPDRKHIGCVVFDYYTIQEIENLIIQTFTAAFPSKTDDGQKNEEQSQTG